MRRRGLVRGQSLGGPDFVPWAGIQPRPRSNARSEPREVLHLAPELLQRLDADVGVRQARRVEALIAAERATELAADPGLGRVIRVGTEALVPTPERAFAAGRCQAEDLRSVGAELKARRQRVG